jgi:hypothetical protein
MQIQIDGYRTSSESWLMAQQAPVDQLPAISEQEAAAAAKRGSTPEAVARRHYAAALTQPDLERRAETVGLLVQRWMQRNGVMGLVSSVRFNTLEGKFRVEVSTRQRTTSLLISEDVIDRLLDSGSREAEDSLERLLDSNLGLIPEAMAS